MAWEDGMTGVWRLDSKSSKTVQKRHELMDTANTPALTDNLMDKTEKQAIDFMLNQDKRVVRNEASLKRASMLLGICDGLDQDDCPSGPAASRPLSRSLPAAQPLLQVPTPASSKAPSVSVDLGEEAESTRGLTPLTGLSFLKARAASAQPAAAEPKSRAKAKPKAKGKNQKIEDCSEANEPANKRRRTQVLEPKGNKTGSGCQSSSMTQRMADDDEQWKNDNMDEVKRLMNFNPPGPDGEFRAHCTERVREVTAALTAVRTRKRMLKRRAAENREPALKEATDIEELLQSFSQFCKNISKSSDPADATCATSEALVSQGAVLGKEIYVRIAKTRWMEDMQYLRWGSMLTSSLEWIQSRTSKAAAFNVHEFLGQQMNVILQKLVKAIPADKATWLHKLASVGPFLMNGGLVGAHTPNLRSHRIEILNRNVNRYLYLYDSLA
jgi:hypothetical protein